MRARDQSSIFSTDGKFCPDYGLLLELHALTLVTRSYALLLLPMWIPKHDYLIGVSLGEPHTSRTVLHIHTYLASVSVSCTLLFPSLKLSEDKYVYKLYHMNQLNIIYEF